MVCWEGLFNLFIYVASKNMLERYPYTLQCYNVDFNPNAIPTLTPEAPLCKVDGVSDALSSQKQEPTSSA